MMGKFDGSRSVVTVCQQHSGREMPEAHVEWMNGHVTGMSRNCPRIPPFQEVICAPDPAFPKLLAAGRPRVGPFATSIRNDCWSEFQSHEYPVDAFTVLAVLGNGRTVARTDLR
jgi:hypothetical protein